MELAEVADGFCSSSIVNIEDEITAVPWPSELDNLHSRKMKRTNLLDGLTKPRGRCSVVAMLAACVLLAFLSVTTFLILGE